MSASNKLIFSLEQTLTDDEKSQACKNIGASRTGFCPNTTATHQVTQAEAQNGTMKVSFQMPSSQYNDTLTMFQVELDVPQSANLGQNSYPMLVELRLTDADSGTAHETMATGVLCRTSSNSQWKFITSFMFDFRRIGHEWSLMEIELDWGAWTIPQNTEVIYSIARSIFM